MNPFELIIMRPLGWVLKEFYLLFGNYGVALIVLSIAIKLVLLPLSMKAKKSSMKMSRLTPRMKQLEKKYGSDRQRYQQAVMMMYREEGVSTTGGCLWSFIPLLILIPLFYTIRAPLTYMMGLSGDEVNALVTALGNLGVNINTSDFYYQIAIANHIHTYFDQLVAVAPNIIDINFNFLGIPLAQVPSLKFWDGGVTWASVGLFMIPLLSGGSNFLSAWLSQRLNNSVVTDARGEQDKEAANSNPAMKSMKYMLIVMPIMSIYIAFIVPAGMGLYWTVQALCTVVQEYFLTKRYRKAYDAEDAAKHEAFMAKLAEEDERERKRAERRAQNPEGQRDPNTSKKKRKPQQKLNAGAGEDDSDATQDKHFSGDPERPYCRGRAYKADRYGRSNFEDEETETLPEEVPEQEPAGEDAASVLTEAAEAPEEAAEAAAQPAADADNTAEPADASKQNTPTAE